MEEAEFRHKDTRLAAIQTYGLSIRRAIGDTLAVDGMRFYREAYSHKYDALHTGETSDVFEMEGTGKKYRITITPIPETHGGKNENENSASRQR